MLADTGPLALSDDGTISRYGVQHRREQARSARDHRVRASMTSTDAAAVPRGQKVRVLVAIASYGEKNLSYLRTIIDQYRAMPSMSVDVVVLSEAPKDLPPPTRVAVGLPSPNPWSLPFGHKKLFADKRAEYDLFIYSEDDMGVREENILAFMEATRILAPDEIAGFLRYEKSLSAAWMPDAHSTFRWRPESVIERQGRFFAQYTNEHAAFFILTRYQLQRAIESGGFLKDPYEGKYDMLCAAATDPYTSCGFRRVVCISNLQPFLIHHMSDRYTGQMGMPLSKFEEQIATLRTISAGAHPATTLCEVESKVPRGEWSKGLYETPHEALLAMLPAKASAALSIGCGSGDTEAVLRDRGAAVTVLPLDSVIGAEAAKRGLTPVYGSLDDALGRLRGTSYDCVLATNLLHLQEKPEALFERCVELVARGGSVIVDSPNFRQLSVLLKRAGEGPFRSLRSFSESGVTTLGPGALARIARRAGLTVELRWYGHSLPKKFRLRSWTPQLGWLTAAGWVLKATRSGSAR